MKLTRCIRYKIKKSNAKFIIVITLCCLVGWLAIDLFHNVFNIKLEIIDSTVMASTLFAAIIFGILQLVKQPNIIIDPNPILIDNEFYITVANLGDKMSNPIVIEGNVATQNRIAFLAPNEKIYIKISTKRQYNCFDQNEEIEGDQVTLYESEHYQPNVGISKDQEHIYICNNTTKKDLAGSEIQWLYEAKA